MIRLSMAVLMLCGTMPASAAETAEKAYEAEASIRYVDLDSKGSKNMSMEYDGKTYEGVHGDVAVSGQGEAGTFDLQARDLGSNEEELSADLSYKSSLQAHAKVQNMHHRQGFIRSGMILDGVWQPMPIKFGASISTGDALLFRRTEAEAGLLWRPTEDTANWLSLDYWSAEKKGGRAVRSVSSSGGGINLLNAGNVDNLRQDLTAGIGKGLGENAAMSVDYVHSSFEDHGSTAPINQDPIAIPQMPYQSVNAAEVKFRYNAGKAFSFTGALVGRERENMSTAYKTDTAVAALNAAWRVTEKLSLLTRFYLRAYQIDENVGYQFKTGSTLRTPNYSQMDKTTLRGELSAGYRPVEPLLVKVGYKLEYNHRRDAPAYAEPSRFAFYSDGTMFSYGDQSPRIAEEDTKHVGSLATKVELPFGIEAEADYKRMRANRSALPSLPNKSDEVNGAVNVPFPKNVELALMTGYLQETGDMTPYNHHLSQNVYRGSLDWAASNKVGVGLDGSYESIRYFSEGWIGSGATTAAGATVAASWHEPSMKNHQKNTSAGVHGRVVLPKGFAVSGNGSYVWAKLSTPMHWASSGGQLGDDTPNDTRIARGTVALEYAPESLKHFSARASYSIDDWVDKTDPNNSGRASIGQVGVTAKF